MSTFSRSAFIAGTAAVLAAARPAGAQSAKALRVGYQKDGVSLIVKQQGLLERRLSPLGVAVSWSEFNGPTIVEALNGNGIDIAQTGDSPPIFAQVAGASFVYLAAAPDAGRRIGIVVRADGGIHSVADLRGKRVAFTRGAGSQNLVVKALEAAKVPYDTIQAINLQPPDAAAAFHSGSVDALAIWDPFFALAERFPNTRTLITAEHVAPSNRFFLTARTYAEQNPRTVSAFVDVLASASRWAAAHSGEIAQTMATVTGVDITVERIVAARDIYEIRYMDDAVIRRQQDIADGFVRAGLIPHAVDVRADAYVPNAAARASLARALRG